MLICYSSNRKQIQCSLSGLHYMSRSREEEVRSKILEGIEFWKGNKCLICGLTPYNDPHFLSWDIELLQWWEEVSLNWKELFSLSGELTLKNVSPRTGPEMLSVWDYLLAITKSKHSLRCCEPSGVLFSVLKGLCLLLVIRELRAMETEVCFSGGGMTSQILMEYLDHL